MGCLSQHSGRHCLPARRSRGVAGQLQEHGLEWCDCLLDARVGIGQLGRPDVRRSAQGRKALSLAFGVTVAATF